MWQMLMYYGGCCTLVVCVGIFTRAENRKMKLQIEELYRHRARLEGLVTRAESLRNEISGPM